jgi:hypothetical protein
MCAYADANSSVGVGYSPAAAQSSGGGTNNVGSIAEADRVLAAHFRR